MHLYIIFARLQSRQHQVKLAIPVNHFTRLTIRQHRPVVVFTAALHPDTEERLGRAEVVQTGEVQLQRIMVIVDGELAETADGTVDNHFTVNLLP